MEELAFARMMLAEPTARNRAVYADWLSDEVGDTERAALVREGEGLVYKLSNCCSGIYFHEPTELFHDLDDCILFIDQDPYLDYDCFAHIWYWIRPGHRLHFHVRADGTSPDNPHNWAWLLSLALDRGLLIPGLTPPPRVPAPLDRTPRAASPLERVDNR